MDKRDSRTGTPGQTEPPNKDLFAARNKLYDRIKIPLKTLDFMICALIGALILALILGICHNFQ